MMLSVVMVSLLQIKSDNIFIINKADEKRVLNDYILLSINTKSEINKNENIRLDRVTSFENYELRKELKNIKIKIKDEKIDTKVIKNDLIDLSITTYSTSYSIKDEYKKKIYSFKIEL